MAVENLPHWAIKPNWRSPLVERLSWLTGLMRSESGAEQRFGLRQSPRRYFEPLTTPIGTTRTLFDLSVGAVGIDPWYMPVWMDVSFLTSGVSAAATTIPVDTTDRQFEVGGFVMLRGSEYESEVLEVTSVSASDIEVAVGPTDAWPEGAEIYPCLKVRLTDRPDMSRINNRIVENSLRFEVLGTNDYTPTAPSTTYLGFPVLTIAPDESVAGTHGYERIFDVQDNQTGIAEALHSSTLGLTSQGHSWLCGTRVERNALREFFYALEGRCNPLWLPTFAEDLTVTEDVLSADTSLVVFRCGFTDYGGPREGREDVIIFPRSGSPIIRRITGSSLNVDGTENIVLSAAVGADLTAREIKQICFLSLNRLDGDDISFDHSAAGVCRVSANFRSAPDIRDATAVTSEVFTGTTMTAGACGDCTPGISLIGSLFLIEAGDPDGDAWRLAVGGMAAGTAGDFAVTYKNDLDAIQGTALPRARVVDDDNTLNAAADLEYTATTTDFYIGSSVARLGSGNYITVLAQRLPAFSDAVVAHTLSATGALVSSAQIRAPVTNRTISVNPIVIAASGSSGDYYVVTTVGQNASGPTPAVIIEKRNADHSSAIADVTVYSSVSPAPTFATLRQFGNGNILVVWDRVGGPYFQVFDSSLSSLTSPAVLTDGALGTDTSIKALTVSAAGIRVTWEEYSTFSVLSLRHREVQPDGTLGTLGTVYTSAAVSGGSGPDRRAMSLATKTNGSAVVLENVTTRVTGTYFTQMRATLYMNDFATLIGSVDIGNPVETSFNLLATGDYGQIVRLNDDTFVATLVIQDDPFSGENDLSLYGQRIAIEECL